MKVLLDTHAFLWYFAADPRLSKTAVTTMADVKNDLLISMASLWEIGIKVSIGKLTLPVPFATFIPQRLQQANIAILDIRWEYVVKGTSLPFHHKDPFDRMLAAQCLVEDIALLSSDPLFDQYGVRRIW